MSLDGKVCRGHRAFRIISASKKLRMTFCLSAFGKWNACRAKDEAMRVSEDNLIEDGCLSFRGEQQVAVWKQRPCGLMVTSRRRGVAEPPASRSSDGDVRPKLWDGRGAKAWYELCVPPHPMSTRKPSEFRLPSISGVNVANVKLDTTFFLFPVHETEEHQ